MLPQIQNEIKAPKGQLNKFGNYKYRSCEDIVEAAKPVLLKHGYALILSDEIVEIGGRFYVKATATIKSKDAEFSATAFAREEEMKKGMDGAQITGSASSYARKYALNGLFAIDDTKDADATNTHEEEPLNTSSYNHKANGTKEKPLISNAQFGKLIDRVKSDPSVLDNAKKAFSFEPSQLKILTSILNPA